MFNAKGPKQHASSQTHGKHRQLFADYPYPILTELNKAYEQRHKSSHSSSLVSSKWYKENFRKLIAVLHDGRSHDSSSAIVEQSFRSTHLNEYTPTRRKPADSPRISSDSITSTCTSSEEINPDEGTQPVSIRL